MVGKTGLPSHFVLGDPKGGGLNHWRSPSGFFAFPRRPLSSELDASSSKSKTSAIAEASPVIGREDRIRTY
jgi:hypothetical protein